MIPTTTILTSKDGYRLITVKCDDNCTLKEMNDSIIHAYLEKTYNNMSKTAKILGISRQTIYNHFNNEAEIEGEST